LKFEKKALRKKGIKLSAVVQIDLIKKGGIIARSVRRNLFDNYALNHMKKKVSQ